MNVQVWPVLSLHVTRDAEGGQAELLGLQSGRDVPPLHCPVGFRIFSKEKHNEQENDFELESLTNSRMSGSVKSAWARAALMRQPPATQQQASVRHQHPIWATLQPRLHCLGPALVQNMMQDGNIEKDI